MPFWSRKGKEKALKQDDLKISLPLFPEDDVDYLHSNTRFQSVTADTEANATRARLKAHWHQEAVRLRDRALKVEEAEGKCSIAHMAATEAAIEAINMCLEVSARETKAGVSMMSDAEDVEILRKYEETGEAAVPPRVMRSTLETLMDIHEQCCCSHVKRDPAYRSKVQVDRSFRGSNPIREASQSGSSTHKVSEGSQKKDEARGLVIDGDAGARLAELADSAPPPAIDEEGEGLPSYKQATS